jgi:hypothetical protein
MKHPKGVEKKELEEILSELTIKSYKSIRERQDKEDELLNLRTGSFLTANTILFAVTQLQKGNDLFLRENCVALNYGIAIVGILVTIFWILISFRTSLYINYFASIRKKVSPHYTKFIPEYKSSNLLLFPTTIVALWLPLIILSSWFAFFAFVLFIEKHMLYFKILVIFASILVITIFIKYWLDMYNLRKTIKDTIEEQNIKTNDIKKHTSK